MDITVQPLQRRRLLQLMALSPLLLSSVSRADGPDISRIAALEWRPVELLMALGIMPLAIADVPNYRRWVIEPALPDSVLDLGLRNEPNLERLQRLHPSLILLSNGFGPDLAPVRTIAPVWVSGFTDGEHSPLAMMRSDIVRLGARLNRARQAEQHLQMMDERFNAARRRLAAFSERPLLMFSFLDSRRVLMFGHNSLFADVIAQLGLKSGWQGETNVWGSTIVGIETLAQIDNVRALCFTHGENDPMEQLAHAALWRSIPFVREAKLHLLPAVWFYGATFSALRFCRLLEHTLLGEP